ncbi:MAG: thioredoxin family protein, partial [Verrucomicrobiales bacterium]
MLDASILNTLGEYTKNLSRNVELRLLSGQHPKRAELAGMLQQVASVSDKLSYSEQQDTEISVREGLTFELLSDGERTGILFSGIPGGHEFNSFILAILQAGGTPVKLDEGLQRQVRGIDADIMFETFISLECHVCPDVVQTLNQLALINPRISNEMIDGGLHQPLVTERNIQGVPTVFLNKKPFSSGEISAAAIIEKLVNEFHTSPAEPEPADDTIHDSVV